MAKEEFGAKAITLETIANEEVRVDSPRRIALKRPIPTVSSTFIVFFFASPCHPLPSPCPAPPPPIHFTVKILIITIKQVTNQDWYSRRGYGVYLRKVGWTDFDETGKEWHVKAVFLRKEL